MKHRLIRRLGMAAAAVGLAALAFTSATANASVPAKQEPAAAPAVRGFLLVNQNSGRCVGPAVGSPHDGAAIVQDSCNGGNAAWRWYLRGQPGGFYEIRNTASEKCIDVFLGVPENNTVTILFGCNGGFNQHWAIFDAPDGQHFEFRNRATGKCLDVTGGFSHLGAAIQQYDCNRSGAQRFRMG